MRERKYTLPRHTNLAKQSTRTSAFLVDFAIAIALTFFFVFALFRPMFKSKTDSSYALINKERINSGLYVEKDGAIDTLPGGESYDIYLEPLKYFYLNYLTGNNIAEGKDPSKDKYNYDIKWFNENVLKIGQDDEYGCFKYDQTDGVDDPSKFGVLDPSKTDLAKVFMQKQYKVAILEVFNNISNVKEAGNVYMFFSTLSYSLAIFVAGVITYVVLPWILKNGQSVGKKIFHLGLATSDGYSFKDKKLLMRFVPYFVVSLSLIFLLPLNMYIVLTIVMVIFLVSFTFAMSSPKRMSLHDFTAQSIVVDLKTSIVFDTVKEEEQYILKEDHLLDDAEKIEGDGEEPELKYEK